MTSGRRKLFWTLTIAVAGIALFLAALPVWLPAVLRPLLQREGIRYDRYEHLRYNRFALLNVRAGHFRAERVEVGWGRETSLTISRWRVEWADRHGPAGPRPNVFQSLDAAAAGLATAARWLPLARLDEGVIARGTNEIAVARIEWQRGIVNARLRYAEHDAVLRADLRQADISLAVEPLGLEAEIRARRQADAWSVDGWALWPESRVEFTGEFARDGTQRGRARSEHFCVPAALLGLTGADDLTGQFTVDWTQEQLLVELSASAAPLEIELRVDEQRGLQLRVAEPRGELNARGRVGWRAGVLELRPFTARLDAGEVGGQLAGAARIVFGESAEIVVETLALERGGERLYESRGVSRWAVEAGSVKVDSLYLTGREGHIFLAGDVQWPGAGNLQARGGGVVWPAHDIWVDELDLKADWRDGPVAFELSLAGHAHIEGETISVNAKLAGNEDGIRLESLTGADRFGHVVTARGTIPVAFVPPRGFALVPGQEFDVQASTLPNDAFWDRIAKLTGLSLSRPILTAHLSGPAQSPTGQVALTVETIRVENAGRAWRIPELEKVRLHVDIDQTAMRAELTGVVEGQTVRASGAAPVPDELRRPDWDRAVAELHVDRAEIAPLSRVLPRLLSPQGTLDVDLQLREGRQLFGEVQLHNAATRPLDPVGPIRDMNARIVFRGRRFEMIETGATVGGAPVRISGGGVWPERGEPEFDLALGGENVALIRRPELLVRATLALNLTQTEQGGALRGEVIFGESLFLQELRPLAAGHLEQPRQRPPYFSFETEPLADWKLDVRMKGDRFLRARTPLFRGDLSTRLHLAGTLKEPVALGEVRINAGTVLFPFGNVNIERGLVMVTSENPHRPQLFVTGTAEAYGYNIRMEVTGFADEPVIVFTSTPPLGSEQILLMLTAGELPRQDMALSTQERGNRLAVFFARHLLMQLGFGDEAVDRLMIRPGEHRTEAGGLTYNIEYRLSERWSATAEYDRFNELNVGLKWRLLSK